MSWFRTVVSAALMAGVAACASTPPPLPHVQKTDRVTPAAVDTLVAYVKARSQGLDDIDLRRAAEAQAVALEFGRSGAPTVWRNPDSGNSGETIPGPAPAAGASPFCRSFTQTIMIKGPVQSLSGNACRDANGVWIVRPS